MKTSRAIAAAGAALLLAGGIAGCEQEGPMERLGESVDESVEQARESVSDAVDPKGPLERAGERVDESVERVAEEIDRASSS